MPGVPLVRAVPVCGVLGGGNSPLPTILASGMARISSVGEKGPDSRPSGSRELEQRRLPLKPERFEGFSLSLLLAIL